MKYIPILLTAVLLNVLVAAYSYQQTLMSKRETVAKGELAKQEVAAAEQIKRTWQLEKRMNPIVARVVDLAPSNPALQQLATQAQLDKYLQDSRAYLERTAPLYDTPTTDTAPASGAPNSGMVSPGMPQVQMVPIPSSSGVQPAPQQATASPAKK